MLFPIYFSHGYREREAQYNNYFGTLLQQSGFLPSLDPPSDDLNSAKLERHLKYTNGLIAIVTKRDNGISPYIRYEINMCLMSGKPVMAFIEDNLPDNILPNNALQKRFSTRSFAREVYEHMNALEIYKKYIGNIPIPKYQIASRQKSCILIGFEEVDPDFNSSINRLLQEKGFKKVDITSEIPLPLDNQLHADIIHLDLAIVINDNLSNFSSYVFGAIKSNQIPTILLTENKDFPFHDHFPNDFQNKIIPNVKTSIKVAFVENQIRIFEEDFIKLGQQKQVDEYIRALAEAYPMKGNYYEGVRNNIINKISTGDSFQGISDSTIANRSEINDAFNKGEKDE